MTGSNAEQRTRTRSFTTPMTASWPAPGPQQGSARSPIPYVHRGPGAGRQPCGAPASHAAPGRPPPRPIADLVPFRPARTAGSPLTARQVTGQQNLSLPVPLTGLALAHRPGQVKPRRLAAAKPAGLRFSW